ncbi:hypothetical protein MPSEU_000464100 [Mayamaea pseudoterrestris]|nr:hypothetical protein MPSEU_000464100 [Mayamaea pseudoterrestris]
MAEDISASLSEENPRPAKNTKFTAPQNVSHGPTITTATTAAASRNGGDPDMTQTSKQSRNGKLRRPKHLNRAIDPNILRGSYTIENDPFPTILRCRAHQHGWIPSILDWNFECPRYTTEQENALRQLLLVNEKKERGMMLRQPAERLTDIMQACETHNVSLHAALSLRRHCIKWNHPKIPLKALGLGDEAKIRESAERFERAVGNFLVQQNVRYFSEREQSRVNRNCRPYPPTPDFILHYPVTLRRVCHGDGSCSKDDVEVTHIIHWMEAKMYYGANTVPCDDARSANGTILPTAEKYVRVFGPGAMVFMHGCGRDLANQLLEFGVVALDGSTGNLDLERVHAHQRTWCANKDGLILP